MLHVAQASDSILPTYQKLISAGSLDGFVLVEPYAHDLRTEFLAALQVPFVVHGRTSGRANYPYYDIDNYGLARDSARLRLERERLRKAMTSSVSSTTIAMVTTRARPGRSADDGLGQSTGQSRRRVCS